ncbi:MAG: hypothetical protein M2R46_00362 [Verrucomicrobia subdivision 3 bacterium]|nr:hypothetical protein [Limisphaerales bacterium]
MECPKCHAQKQAAERRTRPGVWRCRKDFTVRIGSVFERGHVSLQTWPCTVYLLNMGRKGVSSWQLSRVLGVTHKTAWFMEQRIGEACEEAKIYLEGVIEIDETYLGGKEKNRHFSQKKRAGRGPAGKMPVAGMRERNGRVLLFPAERVSQACHVRSHPPPRGSPIYTDDFPSYTGPERLWYRQRRVNHSARQYAEGQVRTKGIESVWAVLKRGFYGTIGAAGIAPGI